MYEETSKFIRTGSDIAVQETSECPLSLAAEESQAILDALEVAIVVADEQDKITSWNIHAQDLLDMASEALYQKPIQALYPPQEWDQIAASDFRHERGPGHFNTQILRSDREPLDVKMMLSGLQNAQGQVTGSVIAFQPLPSNSLQEERVNEANRIKSEFVSTVSHELRTPLTSIMSGISIMLGGMIGKINEEQEDVLGVVQKNLARLNRLINDLLDLDKLESGKMRFTLKLIDVNEIVRDVHKLMLPSLKDRPVDFVLKLAHNLPKVKLDPDRITQVIANLVSNSIKFTEQGNITITTKKRENTVQISVSDTGCGINEKDLPKAFQKFEQLEKGGQSNTGGTGLGLPISKDIVELHRGKICCQPQEDTGATFHVILPIIERRRTMRKKC